MTATGLEPTMTCKRTLKPFSQSGGVFVYGWSGYGFVSRCRHLNKLLFPWNHQKTHGLTMISGGVEVTRFAQIRWKFRKIWHLMVMVCECDNGCEYGKKLTGIRYELKKIWHHFTQEMLWKPLRDLYVIFWNISGCYEETGPKLSFFKSETGDELV